MLSLIIIPLVVAALLNKRKAGRTWLSYFLTSLTLILLKALNFFVTGLAIISDENLLSGTGGLMMLTAGGTGMVVTFISGIFLSLVIANYFQLVFNRNFAMGALQGDFVKNK